jgi:polysaccharide export outer membrane protein
LLTVGDVLQVNVVNQSELNASVRVEPDGTISLPYVGRIKAAGLTEDKLKQIITAALRKADVVKEPQVLVEVTTFGTEVSVLGAVGLPGTFTLDRPTTLVQVLSRAGGLKEDAGAATVVLRRRGPKGMIVHRYDAKAIEKGQASIMLQNNDEIYVEQGAQVSVLGAVGSPGAYSLDRPTTLIRILARAGGIKEDAGVSAVLVRRHASNGVVVSRFDVKMLETENGFGHDFMLQNNDEVYVEQGAVYYLYGYVNKPGEYPLGRSFSVQQAIAAGGGLAPLGSDWRIEIKRRLPDGTVEGGSASLDDLVQPEDTIIVNERIF